MQEITSVENERVDLIDKDIAKIIDEAFIRDCDEYGIQKYENLVGVTPSASETLEERKERVLIRWNDFIPYTIRILIRKLNMCCGVNNYDISGSDLENYYFRISTHLTMRGQVDEVSDMLERILPQNMVFEMINTLNYEQSASIFEAGATVESKLFTITSQTEKEHELTGCVRSGSIVTTIMQRTIN